MEADVQGGYMGHHHRQHCQPLGLLYLLELDANLLCQGLHMGAAQCLTWLCLQAGARE